MSLYLANPASRYRWSQAAVSGEQDGEPASLLRLRPQPTLARRPWPRGLREALLVTGGMVFALVVFGVPTALAVVFG